MYWRWKSRKKQGRPLVGREIRDLIRRMCRANPFWGAPRIQSELASLEHNAAQSTADKYMVRPRRVGSTKMAKVELERWCVEIAGILYVSGHVPPDISLAIPGPEG